MEQILNSTDFDDIEFCVVSGKMNINYNYLVALAEKSHNISVYFNVVRMAELMCQCDIAISGCGSTMYELCHCGLPIITFSFADNRRLGADAFDEAGVAINCCDVRDGIEIVVEAIKETLMRLIKDDELRKEMSEKASCLVDGQGVKRLVNQILKV